MVLALYLCYRGYSGIYWGATQDQTVQPASYMDNLVSQTFLTYFVKTPPSQNFTKTEVKFKNGGWLRIKNLTESKARSSRADFVIYDEERQMDTDLYRSASSILNTSNIALTIHCSTPAKGSIFEENYKKIQELESKYNADLVYEQKYDNIPFLQTKKMKAQIELRKEKWPKWYFDMEYNNKFTVPEGAVFRNVIYTFSPKVYDRFDKCPMPIVAGLDWNPVSGHWLVAGKYSLDMNEFMIYESRIMGEGEAFELSQSFYNHLWDYMTDGNMLCVEEGGRNQPFTKKLIKLIEEDPKIKKDKFVIFEEWDSQGITKMNRAMEMRDLTIYCDQTHYPQLSKQLQNQKWDQNAKGDPKLEKDSANSPHALDALLHALHEDFKARGKHQIYYSSKGKSHRKVAKNPFAEKRSGHSDFQL